PPAGCASPSTATRWAKGSPGCSFDGSTWTPGRPRSDPRCVLASCTGLTAAAPAPPPMVPAPAVLDSVGRWWRPQRVSIAEPPRWHQRCWHCVAARVAGSPTERGACGAFRGVQVRNECGGEQMGTDPVLVEIVEGTLAAIGKEVEAAIGR